MFEAIQTRQKMSDLTISLLAIAGIALLATIGLAIDGNWAKVLRVLSALIGYLRVLVPVRKQLSPPVSLLRFMAAGAVAGAISGLIRPDDGIVLNRLIALTVGGAALLGPVHWLAVRQARGWYSRITNKD
jgi:hypothetical protein